MRFGDVVVHSFTGTLAHGKAPLAVGMTAW
jgi:hypothetical protein